MMSARAMISASLAAAVMLATAGSRADQPMVSSHLTMQDGLSQAIKTFVDTLELGHDRNGLSLEPAALDYTAPRQNQYAHGLEGFDHDWIELGSRRRMEYTNLNPGRNTLRVNAAAADSARNDTGPALPVTVRPAPWQTWWAYLAYAALALLLAAVQLRQALRLRQERRYAQQLAMELKSEAFDLEQLIDDCIGLLAAQANKNGIDLVVAVSPAIPRALVGDTLRVRQVLVNLLSNALRFTPVGEVVVRAELKGRSAELATIRLEVNDTGVGIDVSTLQRIFEAFRQADGGTRRRSGGTGLGLSICKHLVETMGGEIGASSQPAVGSTFWCEIPFGVAPQPARDLPPAALGGLRVAVTTPIRSLQGAIAARLAAEGADVVTVDSSVEFESIVTQREDCQVLLIDADWMSRLDARSINLAVPADPRVARIFLSRQQHPMDEPTIVTRRRDRFLGKPVSWEALRQVILEVMGSEVEQESAPTVAGPAYPATQIDSRHVLVAEDSPVDQLVAASMLRSLGHRASCVADGRSAVNRVVMERFDAVLIDAQMPVMDGLEATRLIRGRAGESCHVPVIGLTADASSEARAACLAAGMDGCLSRPYTVGQLRETLDRLMPAKLSRS